MKSFKFFLFEHLSDDQLRHWSNHVMFAGPRKHTDRLFGVGVDEIHEPIKGAPADKSEIHRAVERHFGDIEISHEDYAAGQIPDPKYPSRRIKIGKSIKDPKLKNKFASDPAREGAKLGGNMQMRIVRGVHVVGQTNPARTPEQPAGHSWADQSCKNINNGLEKGVLSDELRNGTVVCFAKDHKGQEIYRATLQPHKSAQDEHTVYALDSEYGVKHPAFTAHAHDVARRLSDNTPKARKFLYHKHGLVYNDNGKRKILHPNCTEAELLRHVDHHDPHQRVAALQHPNVTDAVIAKGLRDPNIDTRTAAAKLPNLSAKNISIAQSDSDPYIRGLATRWASKNVNSEHIERAMNDPHEENRINIYNHPNLLLKHLKMGMSSPNPTIRQFCVNHDKADKSIIDTAIRDPNKHVVRAALYSPRITPEHIGIALEHPDTNVRMAAVVSKHATTEHVATAQRDRSSFVRQNAAKSKLPFSDEMIHTGLTDEDYEVRRATRARPDVTDDHIYRALKKVGI